ncbi:SPOR domain-containing protein [Rhodoflexus sp.]
MSSLRLLIVAALLLGGLASCKKTVSGTAVPPFSMDLSVYRPQFAASEQPIGQPQGNSVPAATTVSIAGDIQAQLNAMRETMSASNKTLKFSQGYRVVIYSGGNRDEANKVMTDVRRLTTEVPELVYEQPNFRVKVGNFFSKTDAFALYTQIKPAYPNAFITNERITIPLEKYR